MEATEVRKLARLEDRHWWYAERRHLLRELVRTGGDTGTALDIGAAGGGNTRVLRGLGLRAIALEYGEEGAGLARERGLDVIRGDARCLPVSTGSLDVVVAFDVLEHIEDDAAAIREIHRILRPGGRLLVAVPAGMDLWSAHDEAVGHVRRYTRDGLVAAVRAGGLAVESVRSWNVLLRPVAKRRRRSSTGSDLESVPVVLNAALRTVVALERRARRLGDLPGVSLVLVARRPDGPA